MHPPPTAPQPHNTSRTWGGPKSERNLESSQRLPHADVDRHHWAVGISPGKRTLRRRELRKTSLEDRLDLLHVHVDAGYDRSEFLCVGRTERRPRLAARNAPNRRAELVLGCEHGLIDAVVSGLEACGHPPPPPHTHTCTGMPRPCAHRSRHETKERGKEKSIQQQACTVSCCCLPRWSNRKFRDSRQLPKPKTTPSSTSRTVKKS